MDRGWPYSCSVGRGRCGATGPGLGSWGRGASGRGVRQGSGLPGTPRRDAGPNFTFVLGQAGGGGAVPERLRPGARGVNPKALQPRGLDSTCHREADVERDRERKQARDQSPGKVLPRLGNYKNVTPGLASQPPPSTCRAHPSASSCRLRFRVLAAPLSMCPLRSE